MCCGNMLIRPHKIPEEYSTSTDIDNRQLAKSSTKQRERMSITSQFRFCYRNCQILSMGFLINYSKSKQLAHPTAFSVHQTWGIKRAGKLLPCLANSQKMVLLNNVVGKCAWQSQLPVFSVARRQRQAAGAKTSNSFLPSAFSISLEGVRKGRTTKQEKAHREQSNSSHHRHFFTLLARKLSGCHRCWLGTLSTLS